MKISLGDLVHYVMVSYGCRAAFITDTYDGEENVASMFVLVGRPEHGNISPVTVPHVAYDANKSERTWHLPKDD